MTRLADRWKRDPGVFEVVADDPRKVKVKSTSTPQQQPGDAPRHTTKEAPTRG